MVLCEHPSRLKLQPKYISASSRTGWTVLVHRSNRKTHYAAQPLIGSTTDPYIHLNTQISTHQSHWNTDVIAWHHIFMARLSVEWANTHGLFETTTGTTRESYIWGSRSWRFLLNSSCTFGKPATTTSMVTHWIRTKYQTKDKLLHSILATRRLYGQFKNSLLWAENLWPKN